VKRDSKFAFENIRLGFCIQADFCFSTVACRLASNKHQDLERKRNKAMSNRETGTVKWFSNAKGYGFIERADADDVFVHHSGILGEGYKSLNEGEQVEFTVEQGEKGLQAVDVARL
jgi:CspA family cold shock protein